MGAAVFRAALAFAAGFRGAGFFDAGFFFGAAGFFLLLVAMAKLSHGTRRDARNAP